MKTSPAPLWFIAVCGMASFGLFTACKKHDASDAAQAPTPTAATPNDPGASMWQSAKDSAQGVAADMRRTMSDTWDKIKDATYEQREAVRERMQSAEKSLDTQMQGWAARKDGLMAEMKPAADKAMAELERAREVLDQKIDALDNASEATWASVKSELGTAWQRVQDASADLVAKLGGNP